MSSYYKTINGKHYDRAMLDIADSSINKKRDSIISLADAKKIVGKASDAGTITEVEARTLNYIFEHYKFTKSAENYFSNFSNLERGEHPINEDAAISSDEDIFGIKEFMAKYYIYFILIALIIFLLYLYSDRIMTFFTQSSPINEQINIQKITEPADTSFKKSIEQQVASVVTAGANEYIVQEKDTLFDISKKLYNDSSKWKALYDRNKDIIEKPTMIFPGQILKTDLKQ